MDRRRLTPRARRLYFAIQVSFFVPDRPSCWMECDACRARHAQASRTVDVYAYIASNAKTECSSSASTANVVSAGAANRPPRKGDISWRLKGPNNATSKTADRGLQAPPQPRGESRAKKGDEGSLQSLTAASISPAGSAIGHWATQGLDSR